ncbi:MAG TPA: glycosyltransferase [Microbacterium sp.]|nr:glycosyltransferase [Microbacterium sp.]
MRLPLPAPARKIAQRARLAVSAERAAFWRSRPVQVDHVLYESFAGNGVGCNPEAIFRRLLDHPDYTHLNHVWAISDPAASARFDAEFAGHPRVRHVRRGSGDYVAALATSGYLVNNATFPPSFGKRPGQVYLNTWHGTPLKHMGFDMPDGAFESANTLRNLLSADYLLAANPFMAETMYEDAYRLRNVYQGRIIEEGYPRIDRQSLTADELRSVRHDLEAAGLRLGGRRIVLFAPTWRGSSFSDPDQDVDVLAEQVAGLQRALDDDVVVLLKTHQIVHAHAAQRPALAQVLVPNTIPANVMLGAADALVTDYSSIFFDYLATGRPIAFLTPDAQEYDRSRGTYLPLDELPGPVGSEPAEVGAALAELLAGARHPRYRDWAERFTPYDDGHSSERIIDIVFGRHEAGYRVRRPRRDDRVRLMLYLGGMRSNGITTSVLNLLGALDPTRYDVTAVMPYFRSPVARANQQRVPQHVRQIFRIGGMNGSKAVQLRRRRNDWHGTPLGPRAAEWHLRLWEDEWSRVLGSARFDWAADFSGYSPFWANLVLHAPADTHAIWLHNEMASDRNRTVGGRARMRRSLGLVFALYRHYDQLVSVSPTLTAVNRDQLAGFAPSVRFRTVRNLPDVQRAEAGIRLPLSSVLDQDEPAPGWLTALEAADARWFISIGRLSPEKNHARLVRAFATVHRAHPDTRLLIVGGGPLEDALREQIAAEGLGDAAFLAGVRGNPYPLLHAASCFVLSSDYEGQPMVLLEAALAGLPIVSTAFASIEDALPPGAIHVVGQDDAALAAGMTAFLDGQVPPAHLDAAEYTATVMTEFAAVADPR